MRSESVFCRPILHLRIAKCTTQNKASLVIISCLINQLLINTKQFFDENGTFHFMCVRMEDDQKQQ